MAATTCPTSFTLVGPSPPTSCDFLASTTCSSWDGVVLPGRCEVERFDQVIVAGLEAARLHVASEGCEMGADAPFAYRSVGSGESFVVTVQAHTLSSVRFSEGGLLLTSDAAGAAAEPLMSLTSLQGQELLWTVGDELRLAMGAVGHRVGRAPASLRRLHAAPSKRRPKHGAALSLRHRGRHCYTCS